MTKQYRILIVDDHHDVRLLFRESIETLGPQFKVLTVPSGEEAFLELSTQAFDLLVADIVLPGISGLELLKRARRYHPDIKVILVTGTNDRKIRRQVADAGADAFFFKPVDIADFLDAAERCLGLIDAAAPAILTTEDEQSDTVSERLARLRNEIGAYTAVLLDDRAHVLARAGDLLAESAEALLFPALMAAFSASERVAHYLGKSPPEDLFYFAGMQYDLLLAHVGQSYALLVAVDPIPRDSDVDQVTRAMHHGIKDLWMSLARMGISLQAEQPIPVPELEELVQVTPEAEVEIAPEIDALFASASETKAEQDADAFWNSFAADDSTNGMANADVLTYDQALQLGLTPEDE